MSNAPTDIYISPTSTPRLSRMDVFTPQPVNWDQLSTHSGRAKSAGDTMNNLYLFFFWKSMHKFSNHIDISNTEFCGNWQYIVRYH